jgi:hypothetical protein
MNRRRPAAIRFVACMILVVLGSICGGCGKSAMENTTVSGYFKYQSTPIARGAVTFFPERGRPTTASTDERGQYTVGLAPGDYRVTVNVGVQLPPGWKEGDPVPPQKLQLPAQYTTRVSTPLKTTVAAGGADPTDFSLQ